MSDCDAVFKVTTDHNTVRFIEREDRPFLFITDVASALGRGSASYLRDRCLDKDTGAVTTAKVAKQRGRPPFVATPEVLRLAVVKPGEIDFIDELIDRIENEDEG